MRTVKLGMICDVSTGQSAPQSSDAFSENGIPFIRAGSLEGLVSGKSESDFEKIIPEVAKKYKLRLFPKNTIVFAKSGMSAKIGRVYCLKRDCYLVSHLAAVSPSNEINADYLMRWFQKNSPSRFIENDAYPSIKSSTIQEIEIPLPPLETQKQIAAILEKADNLCKQCQQVEQELNALAQSVFLEMFGDPVTNPKGWLSCAVSDFVSEFQGGKSLATTGDDNIKSQYRVLKISAVTWKDFKPDESRPAPGDHVPQKAHFVRINDLLFSRANTTELVGDTSYVFDDYENLLLSDKLWRFVWKQPSQVNPLYIWYLFMNPKIRHQLSGLSSGSGGSMKNISKAKLMSYKVILSPVIKQNLFAERIAIIHRMQKINVIRCKESEDLFNVLLQKAFTSELNLKFAPTQAKAEAHHHHV